MTAHKHADLMAQYAQDAKETDRPWDRWEHKQVGLGWNQCPQHPSWNTEADFRRKPQTRVIDWSRVASYVPVKVWDDSSDGHAVVVPGESTRALCKLAHWDHASLETGLWVPNMKGKNPWPEGVIVEVEYRNRKRYVDLASSLNWGLEWGDDDIIASRCEGLADVWRYKDRGDV